MLKWIPFVGTGIDAYQRDWLLLTLWFGVTLKQFRNDELILYPLALYFLWAFVRDFRVIFPVLIRGWILFAFPAWWLLSVLWGSEPTLIVKSGLQMILTFMIAFVAIVRLDERDIIASIFFASGYFALLNLQVVLEGVPGSARGVFKSKNAMGIASVIFLASSLCILVDSEWNKWLRRAAGIGLIVSVILVAASSSATAVLLSVGFASVLLLTIALRSLEFMRSRGFLFFSFALLAACVGALAITLANSTIDPFTAVLDAFGKDRTLTGRTLLWSFAREQISEAPLLGVGYGGYWTPRDWTSPARRIYDIFHKVHGASFSFHNSYFEIAVHQGLIGLAIVVSAVLWLTFCTLRFVFRYGGTPITFFFAILCIQLAQSMTESFLFAPFSLTTVVTSIGALLYVQRRVYETPSRKASINEPQAYTAVGMTGRTIP